MSEENDINNISSNTIETSTETQSQTDSPSMLMSMLPLAFVFIVFYFLVIRPQSKKIKKHNVMLDQLKKNDQVITSGGIIGTINKVVDKKVYLNISKDVEITLDKSFISNIITEQN